MRLCALAACALVLMSGTSPRVVSDGTLRVPLPSGWVGSVAPGMQGSHPVAWILAGDFPLAARAAGREGSPRVPAGHALVVIGDFVPAGSSRRWREVRDLSLLRPGEWRRVRFAGRALAVMVRFGPRPTATSIHRTDRLLAGVSRVRR